LFALSLYAEAAEAFTKAIEKVGESEKRGTLFHVRGVTYERSKHWSKAEADLKKALELIPDNRPVDKSAALNSLAYSWVDRGINLDEAFKLLQRAVELNPREGSIVDSLGWAYYRVGRYDDAVRELEKAVELQPGEPTINDHLGDAYWKVGRKLQARFKWQHAKDLNPEPENLEKIKAKLERGLGE